MKKRYNFMAQNCTIRTITLQDSEVIVNWRSDENIIKYFYNNTPLTKENHLKWFSSVYLKDLTQYHFIVSINGTPIGFLNLTKIDIENKTCEIGYAICDENYTGKGIAKIVVKELIQFAKEEFNISTFYAGIHKDNISSKKFIEKIGFIKNDVVENKFENYFLRLN